MSKYLKNSRHIPFDGEEFKVIREGYEEVIEETLEPADLLRKLRVQKGWSAKELGDELGVSSFEISKMEEGEVTIEKKMANKLGKLFQIDSSAFL